VNRLRVELWSDGRWVDISSDVVADGWSVSWSMDNTVHRTARHSLRRRLVWASARLRVSGVRVVEPAGWVSERLLDDDDGDLLDDDGRRLLSGVVSRRAETVEVFPLGVFSTKTPSRRPGSVPELFDVDCYDLVGELRWSPGATLALAADENVLDFVDEVLGGVGVPVSLDRTAAAEDASAEQLFPLDTSTTRAIIVNTVLASVGYRPVWSDPVSGAFRSGPDVPFRDLAPVHTFDAANALVSGLREERTFTEDDWPVPNQVIGIVDDPSLSAPLSFTRNNVSEGPASQDVVGVRPTVIRVQAQDADRLEALVNAELARHMRELSRFEITSDWVPAITSGHVCTVWVRDPAVPFDRLCVVESWTLDSSFTMRLQVAPPPVSFPAGVGIAEAVKADQERTRLRGSLPAVIVSTSPLTIRFLGDSTAVAIPLVNVGLSLSGADVVTVQKSGLSWGVSGKLVAS